MLVEDIAAQIVRGCDAAERELNRAVAAAPAVVDSALSHVRVGWPISVPLPGPARDLIRWAILEAVGEAAKVMREAIAMFRLLAKSVGRPTVLRAQAAALAASVKAVLAQIAIDMTPAALTALSSDSWTSKAADSYQNAYAEQSNAADDVPPSAQTLIDTLEDMAASIESFFSELLWAWVGFAVSVAGLAVAIATAGPTLGVGAIIGLVVAVIGVIVSLVSIIMAFTNSASRNSGVVDGLSTSSALVWPTSVFAS